MTRGGVRKERDGPERRCIATGESGGTAEMIRFVLDPAGALTPDLAERLPGRGIWLTADRALVEKAVKKRLFARGFRQPVETPADLAERLEALAAKRAVEALSLARKAGAAIAGFDKVRARLREGPVGALIAARDGAEDGRRKLAGLRGEAPLIEALTADEMGFAFGRDSVIHAALESGGAADRLLREVRRLDGLRQSG